MEHHVPVEWWRVFPAAWPRLLLEPDCASLSSSPSACAPFNPALCQFGRIEQRLQFSQRQIGILCGDFDDGLAFGIGLLRNRSALFITDDRIQRGDQNGIAR